MHTHNGKKHSPKTWHPADSIDSSKSWGHDRPRVDTWLVAPSPSSSPRRRGHWSRHEASQDCSSHAASQGHSSWKLPSLSAAYLFLKQGYIHGLVLDHLHCSYTDKSFNSQVLTIWVHEQLILLPLKHKNVRKSSVFGGFLSMYFSGDVDRTGSFTGVAHGVPGKDPWANLRWALKDDDLKWEVPAWW